jgi:uncharacterized protein (TIGR00725 family)
VTARRAAVAVVGPGATGTDPGLLADAEAVGRGLAAAGCLVVTGGLGGVMAAAARGARVGGGTVVGLLPGDDPAAADDAVDVVIPTGLGEGRNLLVVRASSAVVAIGGSWGTLSEVALARRLGKPVVSLRGWSVDGPEPGDGLVAADSAAEAIRLVVGLLTASPS